MAKAALARVRVAEGRQKKLLFGHPWIYGNEIEAVDGDPADGDEVEAVDFRGRFLGRGFYNSKSLLRVRLLTNRNEPITEEMIRARVRFACRYREAVLSRPGTDCCRLIFGEADRLPGVICDQYGGVLVLQILWRGMEAFTEVIASALVEARHPDCLLLLNDDRIREKEGLACNTKVLSGALPDPVLYHENGIEMEADLRGGQKTGGFLDQKDNHLFLRQFARDRRVLDCFAYSGGFALNAWAAGAQDVVAVDISPAAVEAIGRNARRNGARIRAVCENGFDYLREAVRSGEEYGAIVLDPPAFTKAKANREAAARGYKEIALSAMRLLPPGGVLAAHSCSYHMPEEAFVATVESAARDLRRRVRIIALRRQDIDHPVLAGYPESHYLKSLWLEMME